MHLRTTSDVPEITAIQRTVALACALLAQASLFSAPSTARAEPRVDAFPVHARLTLAAASMVSKDQLGRLGYDSLGLIGDIQLGYAVSPWAALRIGASAGGFPTQERTGGLLAPLFGAALIWPDDTFRTWLQLDVALGFTGTLLRPMWRAAIGMDFQISNAFTLGPVLGYAQLFQDDQAGASTDARFVWFGLVVGFEPVRRQHVVERERVVEIEHKVVVERRSAEPPRQSPPPPAAIEPDPQITALLADALPFQRNEWLAPVLFAFDSAELKPQGVAMLHEVARELARRPKLKLIEIQGYADQRGSSAYNLTLSRERATAVYEWLIAHGVAPERLRVAAEGAANFVESGQAETDHEQNRRVVFRVIDPAEP